MIMKYRLDLIAGGKVMKRDYANDVETVKALQQNYLDNGYDVATFNQRLNIMTSYKSIVFDKDTIKEPVMNLPNDLYMIFDEDN